MDIPKLLEAASLLVPEESATENDITVNDVGEYLTQDEWEVALGLLEELADVPPLPLSFWENLGTAAEQMRLEKSAAWCHWRHYETRNGIIRADLTLRPAAEARRQTSIAGAGVLRGIAMGAIGLCRWGGEVPRHAVPLSRGGKAALLSRHQ